MKVILTKEVLGLGDPGEVVEVKDGYGRNYLVPQGVAIAATKKNVAAVEAKQKRIAVAQAKEVERIQGDAQKLTGVGVTIVARSGEGGKLYGSVTNMDVAKALADAGHDIDRRRILMKQPIKRLGEHLIKVKLHPQVVVEVNVVVAPEAGSVAAEAVSKQAQEATAEE
ncbi:Large ribosomal subunit protein bL9 [Desulfarculales bacterium]